MTEGTNKRERRIARIIDDYTEEILADHEECETRVHPEPWMEIWVEMERMKDPD